jgi:hypothetical protein
MTTPAKPSEPKQKELRPANDGIKANIRGRYWFLIFAVSFLMLHINEMTDTRSSGYLVLVVIVSCVPLAFGAWILAACFLAKSLGGIIRSIIDRYFGPELLYGKDDDYQKIQATPGTSLCRAVYVLFALALTGGICVSATSPVSSQVAILLVMIAFTLVSIARFIPVLTRFRKAKPGKAGTDSTAVESGSAAEEPTYLDELFK